MLTWAMVYLAIKFGRGEPIMFFASMAGDAAIFYFIACTFAGWPK